MTDPIEHLIAYPDLSAEEVADLRRAIEDDPVLARLVTCRGRIAAPVREVLEAGEDSRLFVQYALARAGRASNLTPEERARVSAQTAQLDEILARHPGLLLVAQDVAEAASAFDAIWDDHVESDTGHDSNQHGGHTERGAQTKQSAKVERGSDSQPVRRSRSDRGPHRKSGRRAYRWVVRSAIAAAVVAFAFVLTQIAEREHGMVTVETGADAIRFIELADGSRVRLMESSVLSYGDSESAVNRRAELSGRAYFDIAPESRGFLVETPNARVTVVGTSFGVAAGSRLTEVVLTDGLLTVARREALDDLVVLEPGQMSRVSGGGSPSPPASVDIARRLAWTGLFIFQSTPLDEIAAVLSEHFDVAVTVDEAIRDETVTGTFDHEQPLAEILEVIASAVGGGVRADGAGGYAIRHL